MEEMKRWQNPASGNWECCDEMQIARYLDSVSQVGTSSFGEEDLFKVPVAMPLKYGYPYGGHCLRKVRQGNGTGAGAEKQQIKQGRSFDATAGTPRRRKTPVAVDEDLYKIPPELFYQMPKRKEASEELVIRMHESQLHKLSLEKNHGIVAACSFSCFLFIYFPSFMVLLLRC